MPGAVGRDTSAMEGGNGEGRIVVERSGPRVTITVDRPEKRNAFSRHLQDELAAALDELAADESIALVILTGAGDRNFVSGGDLKALSEIRTTDAAREMALHARAVLDRIRRFPAPVVAAINGDALGGGAELAVACDFRLLASDARLAFVQGRHAISTAWGGGVDLVQLIGRSRALRILATCEYVDHEHGLAIGLYDRCAADGGSLAAVVEEFVAPMLRQPARVLRTYKAMAVAARMNGERPALEATELDYFVDSWVHDDHWAALDSFMNRGKSPGTN